MATGTDNIEDWMHRTNTHELTLMVQHGYTPMQTTVAATKVSSETCRISDKVCTLESGKLAGLLVVDGNILDDIAILEDDSKLLLVMNEGKNYVRKL